MRTRLVAVTGWARVSAAVVARPALWPEAIRQLHLLAGRGWWRRGSHLPLPDPGWARFRLTTQLGSSDGVPEPDDIVAWLGWCRTVRDLG